MLQNFLQGPCRITKKASKGICGAHDYTIVARNLIRMICGGCAAHADHARHMNHVGEMMVEGKAPDYQILDTDKLYAVADRIGVEREGKNDGEIFEELVKLAKEDLTRFEGINEPPLIWLSRSIVEERAEKLEACNIMQRGIFGTSSENIAQTHVGMDADPVNLIFQGLKTSVADFGSEHIATDFSDIIFGTPKPVVSEANLGVLDPDYINIAVHGHNPILSEMIVRAAREMKADAGQVGAKGIKISGICCTGNEVLMRQGVPVLTNFTSQELPIMTGALDAMVVDIQCIMPGIREVAECFHTRIITTSVNVKIPGAHHVDFVEDKDDEKAREVINLATEAFKERNNDRIDIPDIRHKVVAGFSLEAILYIFKRLNPENPINVLTDAIDSGELRGVVLLAGCNNLKRIHDNNHLEIAKGLAKDNVFMVATGCAAGAYAKAGLMTGQAVDDYAGDGLKAFLNRLNEANELEEKLPLAFHKDFCVDNSRAYDLMTAMANLKENGVAFGFSLTITSDNVQEVFSDQFIDLMIEKGALYGWSFHYIPIGRSPDISLMVKPDQRAYLVDRVRYIRKHKPIMIADFWNDGQFSGGCIAGGRRYFHITANGNVEPCAFVHFTIDNIKNKPLKEVLCNPLFKGYQERQPFSDNLLRPCPIIDCPEQLREMVQEAGARPSHEGAETLLYDPMASNIDAVAAEWKEKADYKWVEITRVQSESKQEVGV